MKWGAMAADPDEDERARPGNSQRWCAGRCRSLVSPFIALRTTGSAESMIDLVRAEALAIDRDLPVYNIETMSDRMRLGYLPATSGATVLTLLPIPVGLASLIGGIAAGILLGGFYAAVTVGVSISFGILDIVNIAHPAFIILGSYIAYIVNSSFGASAQCLR